MSNVTANIARQLGTFRREQSGVQVLFRCLPFTVRTEEVAGAKAGQQGVPRTGLNEFIADTVPRVFVWTYQEFLDVGQDLPRVGEYVPYLGQSYELTAVTADTAGDTAFNITTYGLKKVW